MTMETESIYDASSSEFDSIPDVVDSLGPESVAEQDPAEQTELEEQEPPEQEEQGSVDSSEPDSELDCFTVVDSAAVEDIRGTLHDIRDMQQSHYEFNFYIMFTIIGVLLAVGFVKWFSRVVK